jgi:signal peptidase II
LRGEGYPYGGIGIFSNFLGISFSLNYTINTGAAWGILAGYSDLLFLFRVAVIATLLIILWRRPGIASALWLVVAGALGNALDFLLYGHVVDFLHFVFWGYSFPLFNLADLSITGGAVLLFLRKSSRPAEE